MSANDEISARQFMILVLLYVIGDAILYMPSLLAKDSGQDAWIAASIGFIDAIALSYLFGKLGSRFSDRTLIQYIEIILGKWLGRLISLFFVLYIFIDTILMLFEIGDFMLTQIVPRTPIQAIILVFLLVIMQGTRLGVGPLARSAEIFFPWCTLLLLVLTVSLLPQIKFDNIQPVFEHSPVALLKSNAEQLGFMAEASILLMIFPHINRTQKTTKALMKGMLLSNFVLFVITLLSILILGANLTTNQAFPGYILATKIDLGQFLTRIEAILAAIWFITMFVKISICFYATSMGLSQLFKLDNYRPVILPLGVLMVPCVIIFVPTTTYYEGVISPFWTVYSSIHGILLPFLLLLIAMIWKKSQPGNFQYDDRSQSNTSSK